MANQRIQELIPKMNLWLREGYGECYYEIKVEENSNNLGISKQELENSLSVINITANNLWYKTKILKYFSRKEGLIAEKYIKNNKIIF